MKQVIKALIKKLPYAQSLRKKMSRPKARIPDDLREQGEFPPGHFHSPIPLHEDVVAYLKSRKPPTGEILGIDLNEQGQRALLSEYFSFYDDIPFSVQKTSGCRYYYENDWFSYADAIFLYSFLRKYKPKRIIEVGSGFSSAVIMDTVDRCFDLKPELMFIDPNPERLISVLGDPEQVRIIDKKIQDVPLADLLSLQSGDLLFIDSSHVVKCGSDLQFLMFEILPRLQPGVFVHFHDVFYPFDYPPKWLMEGRYWNENYFLRAFLSYNSEWKIKFMNTYVSFMFSDLIKEKMPLCAKNAGGSLYIQRSEQ